MEILEENEDILMENITYAHEYNFPRAFFLSIQLLADYMIQLLTQPA